MRGMSYQPNGPVKITFGGKPLGDVVAFKVTNCDKPKPSRECSIPAEIVVAMRWTPRPVFSVDLSRLDAIHERWLER